MANTLSRRCAVVLLALASLPACLSGLGPGDPQPIRYFSAAAPGGSIPARMQNAPVLRLRRVTSGSHLRERMVWRVSDVEYGFYENSRWTEMPVAWLEQALARELFEVRGLRRTELSSAPTLDVHLAAFEEVLYPAHQARVAVVVRLVGASGENLLERTLERTEPVDGEDLARVAEATARALGTVVRDVAALVVEPAASARSGEER
ncbi:MAG: ABC-type transport auxiliary lipoprotein family protein [Planctomycetota bacterium]